MTTAWKVFWWNGKHLGSIWIPTWHGLYQVYPPGRWVRAKVGGFLCFRTRAEALEFQRGCGTKGTFRKVEVRKPVNLPRMRLMEKMDVPSGALAAEALWGGVSLDPATLQSWPKGTVAYRTLRIMPGQIKRVAAK